MQFKINSLREINLINLKLLAKIIKLKKENAERDEEKATLIARLDDDIKEIKQSSASTSSVENSDICQPIRTEIKTLEEKEMDAFLNKLRGTLHDIISQVTEILLTLGQEKLDILQNIVNLYEKVCNAEDILIKTNQTEILCWSNFIIAFDKSIDEIMVIDRKIERTRKIYKLTERIGLDKIKHIKSYSANSISKFINIKIQRVIDHFTKNSNMEFTNNSDEDIEQDNEVLEKSNQINVLEVLPSKKSTAPIPLVHVSNTSNNFKKEVWFDKDMFFNEVNPTKVNTVTSNDDVYFDQINEVSMHDSDSNLYNDNSNSDDSEEEMLDDSDDDGYNRYSRYSRYNEYDEYDRGYYYRDRKYKRKSSPIMSPIIFLITNRLEEFCIFGT
ncbi:hypothetical protein RhiirA1_455579 [Rhizophagus irregularis]|uniref:Uncharacterized protein n=1 Tax=Rhizophagus irregularis TaxID=588596 RepID=A0A2I1ENQ2_9GLOM|nr:hypothetical protein RhiirA1_455579 [Rhizophagus irregularis]PKY23759.1 hypothetical protein RhiirB3_438066 [Rhizophagus irregularis]